MTLNGLYALCCRKDASFVAHHKKWMKIDPYYQRQKCRTMTLVFGGIRIVRMFAVVPRGGGVKRQWGCQRQFFCVFYCYFSDTLEMRPVLLHGDMRSVVGFSMIPKCVTLNDDDWLFRVKFYYRAGLAGWDHATSENNCVKTNKDRHTLSAVQIFGRDSSFWQYKVYAGSRRGSLERRHQTTVGSNVLLSHAEVYSLCAYQICRT